SDLAKRTDQQTADRMVAAGEDLASLLEACPEGRWDLLPDGADAALASVRQTAENCRSAVPGPKPGEAAGDPQGASERQKTLAALDEIADAADRMLSSYERAVTDRLEIVWMTVEDRRGGSCESRPSRWPASCARGSSPSRRWSSPPRH